MIRSALSRSIARKLTIRKGMMKKISDAGPVVGSIFSLAVKGKQTLPWPLNAVIDKVLFARVKQATGGRLRLAVCGGGCDDHTVYPAEQQVAP